MDIHPGTVTRWQAGRLSSVAPRPRFEMTRDRWLGAAGLLMSALVLAAYVEVLEHDVERNEGPRVAQQARVDVPDGPSAAAPD